MNKKRIVEHIADNIFNMINEEEFNIQDYMMRLGSNLKKLLRDIERYQGTFTYDDVKATKKKDIPLEYLEDDDIIDDIENGSYNNPEVGEISRMKNDAEDILDVVDKYFDEKKSSFGDDPESFILKKLSEVQSMQKIITSKINKYQSANGPIP